MLLLLEGLELFVPLGLLFRLVDEVADGVAAEDFLGVEDLVEVLFEFVPSFLDVFGTFVGDPEDLLLGEGRAESSRSYRVFILLYYKA